MKILLILNLLFLSACNQSSIEALNPMGKINDALAGIPDESDWGDRYYELLNNHRQDKGLQDLLILPEIEVIAASHALNMATKTVPFGHTGSAARCKALIETMKQGKACAELVAKGQNTAEKVFDAWRASSLHLEKLETTRYTHTGIAWVEDADGVYYWTQIFLEI